MCQETCPESSEGPVPSNLDLNVESQPPVIHDIVTTSPSDNEQLEATPFATNISLGVPLDAAASAPPPVEAKEPSAFEGPVTDEPPTHARASPAAAAEEIPVGTTESEDGIAPETLSAGSHGRADVTAPPERPEAPLLADDPPATETLGSGETEEETTGEQDDAEQQEMQDEMEQEEEEDEEGTG